MKFKLEEYVLDRSKVATENKRLITQIQSLLDLQTTVPEKAVLKVVGEEVHALHTALSAEIGPETANRVIGEICEVESAGRPSDWLDKYPASFRPGIEKAAAAYGDLEHRVGYLMKPTTFEELQGLDPEKDSDRIFHFISYEFRLEQKLFANLFEARPPVVPTGALLFHATGEFTLRSVQRINDTAMFFTNLFEWGAHSFRGRQTLERLNGIHGRYAVANDTFKFILANIIFVPDIWNRKLGWRPFCEVEKQGLFHAYKKMGRHMHIRDLPDDREELRQWWVDYNARMGDSTPVQRKTFDEIVLQVVAGYPKTLRRFVLSALLSGIDDFYRNALGYPCPPQEVVSELQSVFRSVGYYSSLLPRIPWIRSLQTYPLGADVNRMGVNERSPYLPGLDEDAPNKGYPTGLRPLGPEEGADRIFHQLPVIPEEEFRKHTEIHSAWTAIGGIIYDLTSFLYEHPGGIKVLKPWLGKDATHAFEKIGHSPEARALMLNFRVGRLPGAENRPLPVTEPNRSKRRPTWEPQSPVTRQAWDELLDSLILAVEGYETGYGKPAVQQGGPVAHFPVNLPSHDRPQGVCPFTGAKPQ